MAISEGSTKKIAIIGAGPAGLAAAKTLLHHTSNIFNVTIFEKADQVGGLWNVTGESRPGFLRKQQRTNLSKFTVSFSDLSWDSVGLPFPQSNGEFDNGDVSKGKDGHWGYSKVPMFPEAWMAERYLFVYAERFGLLDKIAFRHEVVAAHRIDGNAQTKWKITARDISSQTEEIHTADHLVVASGFSASPRRKPSLSKVPHSTNVIHSSQYRSLSALVPQDLPPNSKILVFGGGNSAGELAATVAHDLSSALHGLDTPPDALKSLKIVHATPRPLYAVPSFVTAPPGEKGFMPVDLRLYNYDTRPRELPSYGGRVPGELNPMIHQLVREMIGSDQGDLGAEALVANVNDGPPYVTLSEGYAEFVRSGAIEAVKGRVVAMKEGEAGGSIAYLEDPAGKVTEVDSVVAVIDASGYTPNVSLEWLPQDVLEKLEYQSDSPRLPLILDRFQTMSEAVPDIAFIGFYEGPYWGMIEMQARLIAESWARSVQGQSLSQHEKYYEAKNTLRKLRSGMLQKEIDVPQYWFNDYLGYMVEAATEVETKSNHAPFNEWEGPVSPARYLVGSDDNMEAKQIVRDLSKAVEAARHGAFVLKVTFRALQGRWRFTRKTTRRDRSEKVFESGKATFSPREPTKDAHGKKNDGELLYSEDSSSGISEKTRDIDTQVLIYRYQETADSISIECENRRPKTNFHWELRFEDIRMQEAEKQQQVATATSQYSYNGNYHKNVYEFSFSGVSISRWRWIESVTGSQEYACQTTFERKS